MAGHSDPLQHPELRQGTVLRYIIAFLASALCMVAAYALSQKQMSQTQLLTDLAVALLVSLVTQAALFFGLDISRAQIWKSISLVLALPLFIVTIGITVWVFSGLSQRTMPDPAVMSSMAM